MYKLWKRFSAYIIDILIVTLLTQCLAGTTLLNKNLNNYQKYSKEYNELYTNYIEFTKQLTKYYQDSKLTEKEYNKLVTSYPIYEENLKKYYQNNNLTEKNYNKLIDEITDKYKEEYPKLYYLVEKNSISEMIIYLVIAILYFVVFNYFTNGQTLGKKITGLKIVDQYNNRKRVSMKRYLIRMLPMYQIFYYITRLISIMFLSQNKYIELTTISYYIQGFLEILILSFILFRHDGRGLHDILDKTQVMMCDRSGSEILK